MKHAKKSKNPVSGFFVKMYFASTVTTLQGVAERTSASDTAAVCNWHFTFSGGMVADALPDFSIPNVTDHQTYFTPDCKQVGIVYNTTMTFCPGVKMFDNDEDYKSSFVLND